MALTVAEMVLALFSTYDGSSTVTSNLGNTETCI